MNLRAPTLLLLLLVSSTACQSKDSKDFSPLRVTHANCTGSLEWTRLQEGDLKPAIEQHLAQGVLRPQSLGVAVRDHLGKQALSEGLRIVEANFTMGMHPKHRVWAYRPTTREIAPLGSCGRFNAFLEMADLDAPASEDAVLSRAEAYLALVHRTKRGKNAWVRILEQEPEQPLAVDKEKHPSLGGWFKQHPGCPFFLPKIVREESGWKFRFFSWQRHLGGLCREEVEVGPGGEIRRHRTEFLGDRVGSYIII